MICKIPKYRKTKLTTDDDMLLLSDKYKAKALITSPLEIGIPYKKRGSSSCLEYSFLQFSDETINNMGWSLHAVQVIHFPCRTIPWQDLPGRKYCILFHFYQCSQGAWIAGVQIIHRTTCDYRFMCEQRLSFASSSIPMFNLTSSFIIHAASCG